jgi:cyclophilin family peptidyl-prolyl cis-trans isomerase
VNREAARARDLAATRRRQRTKTARNVIIAAVVVVGIALAFSALGGKKSNKKKPAAAGAVTCQNVSKPSPKSTTFKTAPPMTIDPKKTYTAVLDTSCGKITIALDAKNAPKAVNNFVFLARQHFYDDEYFHRVVKDFVIQDGDPKGDGSGGPGYNVQGEPPKDGYPLGSIAAAKTGDEPAGTMGSQYFIVTGSQGTSLPNDYARFGKVSSGMAVVNKIGSFGGSDQTGTPTKVVTVKKVTITES